MSITFSGLGSGLDTNGWVEALVKVKQEDLIVPLNTQIKNLQAQQSVLSKVKTAYSTLLTATQKFTDSKYGAAKDVFAANTVTSSNDKLVGAQITNSTPRQTLSIQVLQMATSTKVTSNKSVASPIDMNTDVAALASGSVKEGTMSFYLGDKKYSIDVKAEDKLSDIADKMQEAAGKNAEGGNLLDISCSADGQFQVSSTNGATVRIGTNSDTSTLASALAIRNDSTGAKSAYPISALNLSKPLTSADSGFYTYNEEGEKVPLINAGEFKIGSATIKITDSTTMNDLIGTINSNPDANATAFFDTVDNKLVITSKQEGAFNVNIEGGTSNFTDVMGLTRDGDIISDTQTLGKNAEVMINGSKVQSYSNTITSETSGVPGLTLDIKDKTEEGKSVNIIVGQDTDKIMTSIQELMTAINDTIALSDAATAKDGGMQYESRLNSLRTDIRTSAASSYNEGDTYKTLASIGITTGAIGTAVDANTNKFTIDKEKLKEALTKDPQSVKRLLIGDVASGTTGLVQDVQKTTEESLDSKNGFFTTRKESMDAELKRTQEKLTRNVDVVSNYEAIQRKKFQIMDQQISSLQQQFSQMKSTLGIS